MSNLYNKLFPSNTVFTYNIAKIFFGYVALFIIIVILGFTGVQDLKWHIKDISEHALTVELGETFRADVARMRYCEKNLFFVMDEPDRVDKYYAEWEKLIAELHTILAKLQLLEKDEPECKALLAKMELIPPYEQTFIATVKAIKSGELTDPIAANKRLAVYRYIARDMNTSAIDFVAGEKQELDFATTTAVKHFSRFQYTFVAFVAVGFIVVIMLTVLLVNVINKETE